MRTNQDRISYRQSVLSFVNLQRFSFPFAVTLTLKQGIAGVGGFAGRYQKIDMYEARKNFRHFMNLLNRQVYGKATARYGKRINVLPVIEGGNGVRVHYHLILDCPRPELELEYPAMIRDCWSRTPWGYNEIHIQSLCDEGWVSYISKLQSKVVYDESFDWENSHLS
ncbi:hypothetical protein SAMIE_1016990 [Sphingobium amiense]|uniref:Replication-associated protein ORF2/G2P domain-containing protein n=1 Tax=Sphingobium amiense TaxID=135719 RepID=A0A494W4U8_9SPHN|nr:hypothetical protein [Sphingobium amiense]BBD98198.1 hypothetical protein SAMIE_1016990 [Sphingobium amiense]